MFIPPPFTKSEDIKLCVAWIKYAYGDHFGEELPGDGLMDVQMRGFARVLQYFTESGGNPNGRSIFELYNRFFEIMKDIDEFALMVEDVQQRPWMSLVHTFVGEASHEFLYTFKREFQYLECYEIMARREDRSHYYMGINRWTNKN